MPSTRPQLRVAVVVGSTREGRFAPVVTQWLKGHLAQRDDMTVDVVDLAETPLPTVFPAFGQPPAPGTEKALALVSPRLAAADAFVFVTPEYNHSFPASLKNAIDWHNEQWHAKPVAFVSYGGLSGGLRAVEQLRVVMAELNATTIRNTVSFHNAYGQFARTAPWTTPRWTRPPRRCWTSSPGGGTHCGTPGPPTRTPPEGRGQP